MTGKLFVPDDLWWSPELQEQMILLCSIVSIIYGLYNVYKVMSIKVGESDGDIEMQQPGDSSNYAKE